MAEFHWPLNLETTLIPGYFLNTASTAALRSVSAWVPATPVTTMTLPLPCSWLAMN